MELIPDENNSPNSPEKNYIIDDKSIEDKAFWFERALDRECHIYGWGRGLRKATQLYKENMILENILKQKEKEIKLQKQNIEQMRMFLETKTPRIMYSDLDEVSTPDIITPK
jgi:hypothetical protein